LRNFRVNAEVQRGTRDALVEVQDVFSSGLEVGRLVVGLGNEAAVFEPAGNRLKGVRNRVEALLLFNSKE
jgi:hypothetical protein